MSELDQSVKTLAAALESLESKIEKRLANDAEDKVAAGMSSGDVQDKTWEQIEGLRKSIGEASSQVGDIISEAKSLLGPG